VSNFLNHWLASLEVKGLVDGAPSASGAGMTTCFGGIDSPASSLLDSHNSAQHSCVTPVPGAVNGRKRCLKIDDLIVLWVDVKASKKAMV
jgi:hypothetical protein